MIKHTLLFMVLLTITFSQDTYPFFSDLSNQLVFEQKRIYIKEFEKERQLISGGGDEFNPMWLFFSNAPMFKSTPIQTSFYYDYTFEIIQNGMLINEIEFLQFVGLTDLADNIIIDYQNQFVQYQNDVDKWDKNQYYFEEKKNIFLIGGGLILTSMGLFGVIDNARQDKKSNYWGYGFMGVGTLTTIIGTLKPLAVKMENPKPVEPILKQRLTNDQIKSIAESHNRKIYNEILDK